MMRSVVGCRLVPVQPEIDRAGDADFTEPAAKRGSNTFAAVSERVLASCPADSTPFFGIERPAVPDGVFPLESAANGSQHEKVSPM
jgi:hypothetical protein